MDLLAHEPERRRRGATLAAAGCCCCCCCCCVHSLGSIAGALYGGVSGPRPLTAGRDPEDVAREQNERRAGDRYVLKVYWLAVLIVALLTTLGTILENRRDDFMSSLGISLLIIAMCFPFGQLIASVLALIYINVFPPARKGDGLRRLGRITLFSFIWGVIGFAVMVPFAYLIK